MDLNGNQKADQNVDHSGGGSGIIRMTTQKAPPASELRALCVRHALDPRTLTKAFKLGLDHVHGTAKQRCKAAIADWNAQQAQERAA